MHCLREEHECVPSGLTWILSGSFVAPRSCAGSQPATWRAQQQGEQDPWHEAKTSVCASPAIASQRTQYAILVASDHRVRVLHDFGVGRVTRCLDNVSHVHAMHPLSYFCCLRYPTHVVRKNCILAMSLNIHIMGIRLRPRN